jgi:hypothetical protein
MTLLNMRASTLALNEHVVANTSLDIEASLRPLEAVLPVWPTP